MHARMVHIAGSRSLQTQCRHTILKGKTRWTPLRAAKTQSSQVQSSSASACGRVSRKRPPHKPNPASQNQQQHLGLGKASKDLSRARSRFLFPAPSSPARSPPIKGANLSPPLGRSLPLTAHSSNHREQEKELKPLCSVQYAGREKEKERDRSPSDSITMRPVREGAAALVGFGGGGDQAAAAGHVGHAHPGLWRTPTPYLFLGFALMMGLIAVALLILVCTRRKPTGSSRRGSESASARGTMAPLDREPKVVVIMAGDDMPSFLASARPFAFHAAVDAGAGEPPRADAV
uniref:Uncharacterized protein n=1 Tax=Avena sativa TaxID=4498 RepID=A0ACD5ZB62_AVESA